MSQFIQIYVRGYPKKMGEQDLKKFFSKYGKIEDVKLMRDFAFVTFALKKDAQQAVLKTNGSTELQTTLIVQMAKEPKRKLKCFNCGDYTHRSNICPKPKAKPEFPKERDSSSDSDSSSGKKKNRKSKKSKKISKKHRSRSSSSQSSSSLSSPSSSSSSSSSKSSSSSRRSD